MNAIRRRGARVAGLGALCVCLAIGLGGCTDPYSPGQRALGGGVLGAGAGAAIGGLAGGGRGAATGALIGGALGAVGGAVTTPQPPSNGYERRQPGYPPSQGGYYHQGGYYQQQPAYPPPPPGYR